MEKQTGLILAGKDGREIKALLDAGIDIDLNGTRDFEVSIHRNAWSSDYEYGGYIFRPGTEIGGRIGRIYTDTALDTCLCSFRHYTCIGCFAVRPVTRYCRS